MRSRRLSVHEETSSISNNIRALIERRCLALTLNDDEEEVPCCAVDHPYRRLPQQLHVNLSVLKLDGSLFDVCVSKNATVAEIKRAVEEVFASSQNEISWSHVWGHFCLSYDGQKLINDKACLPKFGIKDGDQLQFIRHMSIQNLPLRERPKNNVACKQHSLSSSESNVHEEKDETGSGDIDNDENQEDSSSCHNVDENQEEVPIPLSKLANVFRGWLSTSSLWGISRNGSEGRSPSNSRFGVNCLGRGSRSNYIGLKLIRNGGKME